MGRSRNIKPGFFTNDELVELPFEYRLLFAGLWTIADRDGRLVDRPKKIKLEIFPGDDVDCAAGLQALVDSGFIERYEADGKKFIQVLNWHKHQTPHHKEVASQIPAKPETKAIDLEEELQEASTPDNAEHMDEDSTSHASDMDESSNEQACCNEIASCPTDSLQSDSLNLIPDSLQDTCAEQQAASPPEPEPEVIDPVFITIPRNDGSEHPITESQIWEWSTLFPAVDVRQALRSIRAWALNNPRKRKTKSGMLKFVNAWLSREQDKGPGNAENRQASYQSAADRRAAVAAATYDYDRATDF